MVAQRLDRPGSKLACHERWLDRVWLPEARDLGLHQLYRALDLLAEHGDAVERAVFWRAADLFKLDVDLVFYDATTAWFETGEEDVAAHEWRGLTFEPLRRRGHSKEGRDNDPQVVIALAVTRDGVPVRSWVRLASGEWVAVGDPRPTARAGRPQQERRLGRAGWAAPSRSSRQAPSASNSAFEDVRAGKAWSPPWRSAAWRDRRPADPTHVPTPDATAPRHANGGCGDEISG